MAKYDDLHDLDEDARIREIGEKATQGLRVGFITDDEPGKMERYIRKLLKWFPFLRITKRMSGPTAGVVSAIVEKMDSSLN